MADKIPTEDLQKKALERVLEEREFIRGLTTNMRRGWLRWYEMVRLFRLKNMNTVNRVFLPLAWEQVEQIAPRITAHDPSYQLIPTKNSAIPFTEIIGEWLGFMWEEKNLRRQARLMVKGGLTYGTDFVKLDMESVTRTEVIERTIVKTEMQTVIDPATGLESEEEVETEEVVEETIELSSLPIFKTVDIFDIDIDPRFDSIEAAPAIIHSNDSVRLSDLLADEEDMGYFNLDKIEDLTGGEVVAADSNGKGEKLTGRGIPNQKGSSNSGDGKGVDVNALTVREYWGKFSPTEDAADEKEYVITVVNDAVIIRLEENPYATEEDPDGIRPFEIFVDSDQPNELYGIGEVEPTESIQIGLNKIKNQRLDNVDLVLNRMWLRDRTSGVNPADLQSLPGQIIDVDDMEGLRALPTPDVTNSSYQEEDRYLRDFQMANGTISSAGGGGRDDFINTATGQKQRSKEQESRFKLKIENLEDALSRIGKKMLQMLNAQAEESFVVRRKDDINGGFKFTKIKSEALMEALTGMAVKVKAGSTISDDQEERRNDAIARWNFAVAAFNAGALTKEDLSAKYEELERVAFGEKTIGKKAKGGGLDAIKQMLGQMQQQQQGQLNPNQTQLSPETLVPNGAQPGIGMNPVGPPQL
jgi:hypothetical protein